jgi:phosphatidylglycerophosphatase A
MKQTAERRKPNGIRDYLALALTTFGVGYIPGAPGTYGSIVGVAIYLGVMFLASLVISIFTPFNEPVWPFLAPYPTMGTPASVLACVQSAVLILLLAFCLLGTWAAERSISLLGTDDPHEAVVDEVMGQIITFLFIPFALSWPLIVAGFVLFRIFDIWKPYPIDHLQDLPGGLGICADDIVAGVYAGICLSVIYAIMLSL